MDQQRVAVIGAGPAGLTAAYQLSRSGVSVDVYEAGAQVGGMARSFNLWGQTVDLGPHRFFSSDARVNRLWLELAGNDYQMVRRLTRIYYRGRFFDYPLRPLNVLQRLGPWEAGRCLLSYLQSLLHPPAGEGNFEDWVIRRFGRRLYEIFFRSYTEKLWGISCRELDSDFAAQRIKKLSFYEAVLAALRGGGGSKHRTLVDEFAYPTAGSGLIYERMAELVRSSGGSVHLHTPVRRVCCQQGRARGLELEDGRALAYAQIISTMPLSLLVERLPEAPESVRQCAAKLRFRNTILVYLRIDGRDLFDDNWLYVHSSQLGVGRITNFRNWVPQLYGNSPETILACEYWCYPEDEGWRQEDEELIARARREVESTGLLRGKRVLEGKVIRVPRCYPVYSRGYQELLQPIRRYLTSVPNLQVIGRYGSFKYNNQDHSILMGMLAADNLLSQRRHDLWKVNADDEYQEQGPIPEGYRQPAEGSSGLASKSLSLP